jgi:Lysozyme like domain
MIGNKIIALVIIILFSGAAAAMPEQKPTEFQESSRIESVAAAETVSVSAQEPEPIVEPVEPPAVEQPKPTGDCSLAYNYDWPQRTAYAICMAESRGRATATNMGDNHGKCQGSYGLMQVGCFWFPYYGYSVSDGHNPRINMEVAYKIYKRQGGFGAWTTYTGGKYIKYL